MPTLRTMVLVMILLMAMLTKPCRMMRMITTRMMRDRVGIGRRMTNAISMIRMLTTMMMR